MLPRNGKFMLAIFAAIALGALVFGSAPAALLQFGLLALCPLMMLFMHGGHGGHGRHNDHGTNDKASSTGTAPGADADTPTSATHQHH